LTRKYLFGLAICTWVATVVILICIAIWPQQRIWLAVMASVDGLMALSMAIMERVKHIKIDYKFPLRYAIPALMIATLLFMGFFQAVSSLRGTPTAAFDILNPVPWGGQGLLIWFLSYNYRIAKKQEE